jgi:hypothetical protein
MLEGLAAAQMLVENRKPPKDENPRLAYPIPEIARKLGLHRRTIEYKIQAGKLEVVDFFGKRLVTAESLSAARRLVTAESVRTLFELASDDDAGVEFIRRRRPSEDRSEKCGKQGLRGLQ